MIACSTRARFSWLPTVWRTCSRINTRAFGFHPSLHRKAGGWADRLRRVFVLAGSLSVLVTLVVGSGVDDSSSAAAASSTAFSIETSPALDPPFNPAISDYIVRCTSATTSVTTTGSGPVTIGGTTLPGPASANVPLSAGQSLTVSEGGASYEIRCLPSDFPDYTSSVTGTPQASGYLLTLGQYAAVFDKDGVPVWWYKDPGYFSPTDAKFLSPTTGRVLGWSHAELRAAWPRRIAPRRRGWGDRSVGLPRHAAPPQWELSRHRGGDDRLPRRSVRVRRSVVVGPLGAVVDPRRRDRRTEPVEPDRLGVGPGPAREHCCGERQLA